MYLNQFERKILVPSMKIATASLQLPTPDGWTLKRKGVQGDAAHTYVTLAFLRPASRQLSRQSTKFNIRHQSDQPLAKSIHTPVNDWQS